MPFGFQLPTFQVAHLLTFLMSCDVSHSQMRGRCRDSSSYRIRPLAAKETKGNRVNRLMKTALLALIIASGAALRAAEHPVPLDKNTDAAKCLECHAEKAKGKNVHTAVSMGCLSCHEVRVSKDVTRVKLITATPAALCFTCHADKNPAEIKGVAHKPAMRDCLKCHDPHTSGNPNQLVKPPSGGEKENLCLGCHTTG